MQLPSDHWASGSSARDHHHYGDKVMPIAIIGVAGRFPGDASSPEKLWDLISQGRSAAIEVPKDRFNVDAFYHPHHERQGTTNIRRAHFMEGDISAFDAPFFNITPVEAEAMDPQQRIALECSFEALENAGIRMEDVAGSQTSCFMGSFTRDYSDMMGVDYENQPLYRATGTGTAILSNRISWFFDLKGASVSLDTACSSSLVALDLACQNIRAGESEMSIVGGTNLMILPDIMAAMTSLHFLSPDGICHSFDSRANGYSRGEGCAVVILKPLHLAMRDNDVIRGVIRNTAVNQDGHTPGITLPSPESQEALIRHVYRTAGLGLGDTAYVEAHGTGTAAGDPIEASALSRTFGKARPADHPVIVGSVKTNIGHLEGASGLAQVVKGVLALEKGEIPPNIWFENPNPKIPMEEFNMIVPTKLTPWPGTGLRRVSINSFGYGGTNAHCIIDDAYHYLKARGLKGNHNTTVSIDSPGSSVDSGIAPSLSPESLDPRDILPTSAAEWITPEAMEYISKQTVRDPPKLCVWSSHEQPGIERMSKAYAQYLSEKLEASDGHETGVLLARFAYTLSSRQSILPWKSFVIASSSSDLKDKFESTPAKPMRSYKLPKLGFIFTGQGAQWHAMGRELCAHQVFRESMESASAYFVSIGSTWSLLSEIFRDEKTTKIDSPSISQPACTALQVALVDLLRYWGVRPKAVAGHSSGEIAAAYAKGAITREAAWAIAYHRGRLSQNVRGMVPNLNGAMLAVGLGAAEAQEYVSRITSGMITIACINSPSSVTLSGDATAIEQVQQLLSVDGHFSRRLKVENAYHSPHMNVISHQYLTSLAEIETLPNDDGSATMFSSVSGGLINNSSLGRDYWVSNLLNPVNFLGAVQSICNHSEQQNKSESDTRSYVDVFMEIGPHSALRGPLKQILSTEGKAEDILYLSLLQRGKDASITALEAVGNLFQLGYPLDVSAVNNSRKAPMRQAHLVDRPPFPWNRANTYWFESQVAKNHRQRKHPRKDLVGSMTINGVDIAPQWRNMIRLKEMPWVEGHKVQGAIIYPAAGMMVAAIEAARQVADPTRQIDGYELRDVKIGKAMVVPSDEAGLETMLTMKAWRQGSRTWSSAWQEFTLYSRQDIWERNCSGLIRIKYKSDKNPLFSDEESLSARGYRQTYEQVLDECQKAISPRQFYSHLTTIGLQYGDPFQNLVEVKKGDFKGQCVLKIPDTRSLMPHKFEYEHVIHPATLDNILQMALPASSKMNDEMTTAKVPTSIGKLFVSNDIPYTPDSLLHGYAVAEMQGFIDGEANIAVSTAEWTKPLVIMEQVQCTSLSGMIEGDSVVFPEEMRKLCSYVSWQEDVTKLNQDQIKYLCATHACSTPDVDPRLVAETELAAFIYMKRVLKEIEHVETTSFPPHYQLFFEYMQRTVALAQDHQLVHQSSLDDVDWLNTSPEFEENLISKVRQGSADGAIMCQHGENLLPILRGEIPPLQVLMKDDLLHNIYASGIGWPRNHAQLSKYLDLLAHKHPDIKILEIGAGTAGATLHVLEILGGRGGTSPRFSQYTFTDISSGFFEKAQEKLKDWAPFMRYARLNIEEDPVSQGFPEQEYDVIIASNVLHATHSIDKTLSNVRKLLKDSGKLVLGEITNPLTRGTMIFGTLDGWWMGQNDGRKWGPTLSASEWNDALVRTGFSGTDIVLDDCEESKYHLLSLIVSSATPEPADPLPHDTVVIRPESPDNELLDFSSQLESLILKVGGNVSANTLSQLLDAGVNGKSCIVLLDCERDGCFLHNVNSDDWETLKKVIVNAADVTWVSRGAEIGSHFPSANLITGLARTIRSENPQLALTTLDLDPKIPLSSESNIRSVVETFASGAASKDKVRPEWEYAIRDNKVHIPRILLQKGMNELILSLNTTPSPELRPFYQPGRPLKLSVATPGRLDTLQFIDDNEIEQPLRPDDVEIEVKGAGLNFKDIMVAMGQLQQPALGTDCSGVVHRVGSAVKKFKPGDRVMTWKLGTFCNLTRTPESMCQFIPDSLDYITAASFPVVYTTAYYGLIDVARLEKGESVLIHGAAGGVGQAAIVLAQHVGAEIFATISTEQKKRLLIEEYNIPEDHIFNSRDTTFVQGIMRMTNNRGVDVVLNSLAGEALRESWRCIAWFGRFVEMGQKDIVSNTGLDMDPFIRNVSFHSINLLGVLENNLKLASRLFSSVTELLHGSVAKPVRPIVSMSFSRLEEAFRMMQTGKHIGKIVLEPTGADLVPVIPSGTPAYRFQADATYVLAGGSGGLGRSLARWMVEQGAKNIVFLSRSGDRKQETVETISILAKRGAFVKAYPCDVTSENELQETLKKCAQELPPIRGVIQGAMVLNDSTFQNMTHEQWMAAVRPKVQGSWNLHKHLPNDMDFFVLLSSLVGTVGSRGQGNYAAGNSYQDALAQYRQRLGLPGVAIDVGMVLGVGFLAENNEDRVHNNVGGWSLVGIRENELLAMVQAAITGRSINDQKVPAQLVTGLATGGMVAQGAKKYPWWFKDSKFTHIKGVDTHQIKQTVAEETGQVKASLMMATDANTVVDVICTALMQKLAKSMMVPLDDIDSSRPVSSYGVDSLLAVELRAWVFAEIQADISVFDLLNNVPITTLSKKIAGKSKLVSRDLIKPEG